MLAKRNQQGFALMIYLIMLMGVGGLALEGYLQSVEKETRQQRFKRNHEVLLEAKNALLQFAYNYPEVAGNGPGRLPCADTDNDGVPNTAFGVCTSIGRFPWDATFLNTSELRDASGERLWYAVSPSFATNVPGGNVVNSNSTGTITIKDQSGTVIFDGASTGVAAVIIAPGEPVARAGVLQDRSVDTAANYLDLSGTQDNATLTHGSSTDGFILGPIGERQASLTVNDQVMIVTADEVIAMAEKAVLQAYRKAIQDYQEKIWGSTTANYRYPWLNSYNEISTLTTYSPIPGNISGRVPSFFAPSFSDVDSNAVVTDFSIVLGVNFTGYLSAFDAVHTLDGSSTMQLSDAGNNSDNIRRLQSSVGTLTSSSSYSQLLWFWDARDPATCGGDCTVFNSVTQNNDGWQLCPYYDGDAYDCSRDNTGASVNSWNGDPDNSNGVNQAIQVRRVTVTWTYDANFNFTMLAAANPSLTYLEPTDSLARHAKIWAVFNPLNINGWQGAGNANDDVLDSLMITYDEDDFFRQNFNIVSSGTESPAITLGQFDIQLDYFPELPTWAGPGEDNWNDSVMMAYASQYAPSGTAACTAGVDCIVLNNFSGMDQNKIALLAQAARIPADTTELLSIFEGANNLPYEESIAAPDSIFDFHPPGGDDHILVLGEI